MLHDARVHCLDSLGFSELDMLPEKGPGINLVIGDVQIQQIENARLFDELLIETGFSEKSRSGFRLCHRIRSIVDIGSLDYDDDPQNQKNIESIPINAFQHHHHLDRPTGATFKNIAYVEFGAVAIDSFNNQAVELPNFFFERLGFKKSELIHEPTSIHIPKSILDNSKLK
ncbi:hypothetical protein DLAC_08755 [Tieghemostelium lacteum]|uniref:Uncharacterized protein n=1 Tax=Tieghemostelium lacteum TaxID=361077 RepID=A0A151Z8M8_TIELA|nr:hypothetical protein DLAC_08755 [Tieghemostelium lacteum]|eukprot:KYQ90164.1 hypothetical protein DLAC_08755 [Tieghemostelium lacteum]